MLRLPDLTFDGKLPAGEWYHLLADMGGPSAFHAAVLRVIGRGDVQRHGKQVRLNGVLLEDSGNNDELFPETIQEGQFPPEQTFNCRAPMEALAEENRLEIVLTPPDSEIFAWSWPCIGTNRTSANERGSVDGIRSVFGQRMVVSGYRTGEWETAD